MLKLLIFINQQLDVSTSTLLSSEMVEASCKLDGDGGSWAQYIPFIGGFFKTGRYVFAFNWIVSFIVGIVFLVVLVGFTIDIAIRAIKLAVLRLLAPIPVISYIEPKSAKDGMFASWVKSLTSTYLDLFLRLAIVYFVIFLIQDMIVNGIVIGDAGGFVGPVSFVFIMLGLFFFAKMAPKFIKDALGIKGMGMSNIGLSGILAGAGVVRAGGSLRDVKDAVVDSADANVQAFNQGKAAPGLGMAYNSGTDLAARMITGNPKATFKQMQRGKARLADEGITPWEADKVHNAAIEASNFTDRMVSDMERFQQEAASGRAPSFEYIDEKTGNRVKYHYKDEHGHVRDVTNMDEMSLALSQQRSLSAILNAQDKKVDKEVEDKFQSRSYKAKRTHPNTDDPTGPSHLQNLSNKFNTKYNKGPYAPPSGTGGYSGSRATGSNLDTHL